MNGINRSLTLTLALATLAGLTGCNSGSRSTKAATTTAPATSSTTTAPTTSTTTTAPVASQAPTTTTQINWDTPYQATPAVQNDSLFALHLLASGEVLTGSATGAVQRVDPTGAAAAVSEGSFGAVSGFADANGTLYLGTSQPFFMGGNLGQVYVRDAQGNWTLSLDHPLPGVAVVALGGDLYAFASEFGNGVDATVSLLTAGATTWQQDVATLTQCQLNKAVVFNNTVFVAGSDNNTVSGGLRLFHGSGQTFAEVPNMPSSTSGGNQLEFSTDIKVIKSELFLASTIIDTQTGNVIGGAVYQSADGFTWAAVKTWTNDSPLTIAEHAGLLVAGMVSGNIEVEDPNGNLVQDTGIPANTGVMSLLELSSDTLLAGIRGNTGAELYRRVTTTVTTGGGGNTPPATPALSYVTDVKPIMQSQCGACHGPTGLAPAVASMPLLFNDDAADHSTLVSRVNLQTPDASLLVEKAIGNMGHGGGASIASGSADHQTLIQWIQDGAQQ